MPQLNAISQVIVESAPEIRAICQGIGFTREGQALTSRRAVPMTRVLEAGVDLTRFERDYYYSANFDVLFVERGSRLDIWLYLAT